MLTRRDARAEVLSFPTRLVEYLRVGRPVFVSDVGDVSRYLRDGEDAVLLHPRDPRRVAAAIAAVAVRADRGAALGRRGREAGARAFDRRTHAAAPPGFRDGAPARGGGMSALRVAFVFASRGIGGAERSMLRLMAAAHPSTLDCRVIVPAPENVLLRRAAAEVGVPYHALHPLNLVGLYRRLRRDRPDVVYVFGRFRTLPWALVARLAGVRCIVAAERSAANRKSDRLARRLDRFLVTAYVANSEFAARNLRAILGASGPPVCVVPNGVETSGQAGRLDRGSDPPSLLCVGNITPNKGQGVLLEAVRLLRDRYPGIRATLVGHDFTRGRFFAEARARGLHDTYEALGFAEDVGSHLARATIAVLPTLMREGMPTSLLEAMRAGVPVVASRVGGVRRDRRRRPDRPAGHPRRRPRAGRRRRPAAQRRRRPVAPGAQRPPSCAGALRPRGDGGGPSGGLPERARQDHQGSLSQRARPERGPAAALPVRWPTSRPRPCRSATCC